MADIYSLGGTETLTGSGADDSYFFDNVSLIATATIVDSGGVDRFYVNYGSNSAHGSPGGTSGEFINTGNELIFRTLGGHDIVMPLKANGDSAVEFLVWWSPTHVISEIERIITNLDAITGDHFAVAGTEGDDVIVVPIGVGAASGYSEIYANAGNDRITVSATTFVITYGGYGNDTINGVGAMNDSFRGGSGNDQLLGAGGHDRLDGNDGSDRIFGDTGNDLLVGGFGNDTLTGGSGNDTLTGDSGKDSFVFSRSSGTDRITFWQDGSDVIDLRSFGISGFQALNSAISANGGDAVINLGSFGGNGSIILEGAAGQMSALDFLFA